MLTKQHWLLLILTLGYIAGAGWYFMQEHNGEFLWYIVVVLALVALVGGTLRSSRLPLWLLWLLSAWGLLHMLGGGLTIGDHVLYAQVLWPLHTDGEFTFIKFDQLVHAFGFGVAALCIRHLLARSAENISGFWLSTVAVCAAMGLGALNEIVEFAAVVAAPSTGVGGYYNTALDLIANGVGAIVAVVSASLMKGSVHNQPQNAVP